MAKKKVVGSAAMKEPPAKKKVVANAPSRAPLPGDDDDEPQFRKTKQQVIPDAFPEMDDALESAARSFLDADARLTSAKDKRTTCYDAIKEMMRERGLDVYFCYRTRAKIRLQPEDAKVKVEPVKETESTPFQPTR